MYDVGSDGHTRTRKKKKKEKKKAQREFQSVKIAHFYNDDNEWR
jgi:hypothetical protein